MCEYSSNINHCGQLPSSSNWCVNTVRIISLTDAYFCVAIKYSIGPWQTSRVPQAAPPYCSRPCGDEKCTSILCVYHQASAFTFSNASVRLLFSVKLKPFIT